MIEFERGDDQLVRAVVKKLWLFVEERGIVLIAFQDEIVAATQRIAAAEILRHAPDQKIRPASGNLEKPGEHRGGRCLAVRAGNDD